MDWWEWIWNNIGNPSLQQPAPRPLPTYDDPQPFPRRFADDPYSGPILDTEGFTTSVMDEFEARKNPYRRPTPNIESFDPSLIDYWLNGPHVPGRPR